ncbi:MAG: hypothetical protein JNL12_02165 [Planctomycetes bacterium]|nr:hypothetical protein [Planctomycetota bacterium]
MSLYGTGRREGIAATALLTTLALLVQTIAAIARPSPLGWPQLVDMLVPALGGVLAYRFLRAQGRSRYAGFLVGTAYALSPWLLAMQAAPREQLAAVLGPLALEVTVRCDRPSSRQRWLPWSWLGLSLPFVAGPTVIAVLVAGLCLAGFARTLTCGDRDDERPAAGTIFVAMMMTIGASLQWLWLDPLAPWFGAATSAPTPGALLTTYRSAEGGADLAALLRVPGPLLLVLVALALLRRQRHVDTSMWLGVAAVGALPAIASGVGFLATSLPWLHELPMLPAAGFWATLTALAVLGAAGLDDFLDQPMRRRTALPWLLAAAVFTGPLLPTFAAAEPRQEWPVVLTILSLTTMLPLWRRLGILRFKNVLAAVALLALAIPPLQALVGRHVQPNAVPLGEGAPSFGWNSAHPLLHYAGLAALLLASLGWASVGWLRDRRRRAATAAPQRGAITRKKR